MSWNIFKRIAELEAHVAALGQQVIYHGNAIQDLREAENTNTVTVERFPIITDYGRAVVRMEGQPIKMTEAELKRERLAQSKRAYYQRNRDKILEKQRAKKKDEERKRKSREYARKYYAKKKAQAKPVEQPRFISVA